MLKNLFKSALITVATATLSISAVADQGDPVNSMGQEVDVSFENSQVRLIGEGYKSIKMVNGNPLQLSAFDREGSELLLSINPQTGKIDKSDYAYWMDR